MKNFSTYLVPEGREEIEMLFGPPNSQMARAAELTLPVPIGDVSKLHCHPKAKPALDEFFARLAAEDLLRCIGHIGPCYDNSSIGFPPAPSLHTFGAALTLNYGANFENQTVPQHQPANIPRKDYPGAVFWPKHPIVVIAEQMGFTWGGRFDIFQSPAEFMLGSY